jgi:hypothetical protein
MDALRNFKNICRKTAIDKFPQTSVKLKNGRVFLKI